jgi:hypothetical protein
MPETKFSLPTPSEFLRVHLVWILGITPFLVAALNVLLISRGDPEIFAYLLQNLSLVQLVLGVTLPLIPPAIVLILLGWLGQQTAIRKNKRAKLPKYPWPIWPITTPLAILLIISSLIFVFMVMQMIWVLLTGPLLIHFYLNQQAAKHEYRRSQLRYGANVELEPFRGYGWSALLALLALIVIESFLLSGTTWIPNEIIHLKDRALVSGQVLSSDQEWTTFLDNHWHVQIVRTQDITSREPCYKGRSLDKTLQNLISQNTYTKGTSNLRCPS